MGGPSHHEKNRRPMDTKNITVDSRTKGSRGRPPTRWADVFMDPAEKSAGYDSCPWKLWTQPPMAAKKIVDVRSGGQGY
ncbi:unnamed protein product [Cylicostephanus goldi]|uniref:Uncharacterized protein n=1 Tax=Cylicostephanus goldi TaxID=71465 RepID=A0A3P7NZA9_CYLGO|nr:unnamed protein product [Cylicostephanus goldi]